MIIFFFGGILSGIKQSWHYIQSAVNRGLTSAISYVQARRGGLDVSEPDWSEGFGLAQEIKAGWQGILDMPAEYKVSEEFSVTSPFDWRRQHIMKMKIHGVDLATGQVVEQWITVESDGPLTKSEWLGKADEAVTESPFGYSYAIDFVSEYEYYQKQLI